MRAGMIHKLIAYFDQAFYQLGLQADLETVEDLAVMVHKAMTVQARNFHNLEHVFNFVDPSDPIQTLAALYHDLVYYQVDLGFMPEIKDLISAYIREEGDDIYIVDQPPAHDMLFRVTLKIFDLKPGRQLSPSNGLNEFLSALAMIVMLKGIVRTKDLLRMILCIEATIPFRGNTDQGLSHFDLLEGRLQQVCRNHHIQLKKAEIEEAIHLAVRFANKDVENFAEQDVRNFLENTWKLLPETNIALRSREVYSIHEYRLAIQRMEDFLSSLDPDNVFHRYHGVPSEEEFREMTRLAHKNIETTRHYLRIKLVTQSILEALADTTGGDAPLSLFMGDLPTNGESTQRLEHYLPEVDVASRVDRISTVYKLLEYGQEVEPNFDLKTSPLSFFIFKSLEPAEFERSLKLTREMCAGRITPHEYLKQLNHPVVSAVARASAAMVLTRREKLL